MAVQIHMIFCFRCNNKYIFRYCIFFFILTDFESLIFLNVFLFCSVWKGIYPCNMFLKSMFFNAFRKIGQYFCIFYTKFQWVDAFKLHSNELVFVARSFTSKVLVLPSLYLLNKGFLIAIENKTTFTEILLILGVFFFLFYHIPVFNIQILL